MIDGTLCLDRARLRAEERLDGKYLLSTTDPSLSAEDVALGYKQLLEVERAFRTLKHELDLRPLYHRLDQRIRAHSAPVLAGPAAGAGGRDRDRP